MYEVSPNSHIPCPNCAAYLDSTSKFCYQCGFNLLAQSATPAQVTRNNKTRNIFLFVGGGLMVLLAIAIVTTLIVKRRGIHSDSSEVATNQVSEQTMSQRAQQIEEKILRGESLSQSDISGLTAYELRVLRNVHFARYGRKYDRPGLGEYFYTRSWYHPSDTYSDTQITAIDKANINLILQSENALKTPSASSPESPSQPPSASPSSPADSSNQIHRPSVSSVRDFKKLNIAQGDYLSGYTAVNKAASAEEVVRRFGKPVKSADLNDFYKSKVLFYEAQDEFDNPCYVKLQFVPLCTGDLNCYRLIGIATEPR